MQQTHLQALPARRRAPRSRVRYGYLFSVPGLLVAGALIIYPLFYGLYVSLTEWNWTSGRSTSMTFIGLANYV
ncbi:MAG: sugar ABC transporter permease, partial [Myxococcales bacterium]|nr:sugar ABC transporter permease [Myxococcales bacterium]